MTIDRYNTVVQDTSGLKTTTCQITTEAFSDRNILLLRAFDCQSAIFDRFNLIKPKLIGKLITPFAVGYQKIYYH